MLSYLSFRMSYLVYRREIKEKYHTLTEEAYLLMTGLIKIHFHVHPLKCLNNFHVNTTPISRELFRMKVRQLRLRI